MRATRPQLHQVLQGSLRELLLPADSDQPDGVHRLHRRGGRPLARIQVTTVTRVDALDVHVTAVDARRHGYQRLPEFRDDWCRTYDAAWTNSPAWLVAFAVVPEVETVELMSRAGSFSIGPATGVTDREMEILAILPDDVAQERVRRAARLEQARAIDDVEKVPDAIVERLPSSMSAKQRRSLELARAESEEFTGTIGERLDRALEEARLNRIDTTSIEHLARQRLAELERRNRRAA